MPSDYGPVRAYARLQMGRWAKAGWSAGKIRRRLQERHGKAYRWTTLLSDYREFTGMVRYQKQVAEYSGVKALPRQWMQEVHLRQARKYRLIGQATYYDTDTGKEFKKYVSFYTDDRMSKDGWTSEFDRIKTVYKYQEQWSLLDVDWEAIQHNAGYDY